VAASFAKAADVKTEETVRLSPAIRERIEPVNGRVFEEKDAVFMRLVSSRNALHDP
jgi:hypothetical protein